MSESQSRRTHVDGSEDDGQVKAARSDRSGIEDGEATVAPEKWYVRMPAHHGLRRLRASHRRDLRAELGAVNADVNQKHPQQRLRLVGAAHEIDREHVRQVGRVDVDVAADGMDGRDAGQLLEHFEITDVPCVQDGIGRASPQVLGSARMRLRVGVRYHRQPQRTVGSESDLPRHRRKSRSRHSLNLAARRTERRNALSGLAGESYAASFMINYRVDDLTALIAQLRRNGVEISKGPESEENGKFAWVMDPDGNKIELWEPTKKA